MTRLFLVFVIAVSALGCAPTVEGPEATIKDVLQRDYPPQKADDVVTTDYELFRFEKLTEDKGDGWCVNFVFKLSDSSSQEARRWQGFGDVVKKDGKYVYSFSDGCKLTPAEQKEFSEFKK